MMSVNGFDPMLADGVRDNTDELQALIDSAHCELALPVPAVCYTVSRPLRLKSNFRLVLPRFATIRLADGSNCPILEIDSGEVVKNVEVVGGIWDLNNLGQAKNPFHFPHPECPKYLGYGFWMKRVVGLRLADMTLKDVVTFAITLDTVSYFTVENIRFDFNYGNPWAVNMDGVHLNGNCHYGTLRNLSGACYDDLVALNCDEGSNGPITNIEIDGIFSEDCHSAVRMLTVKNRLENVHIRNVHGTFYQYCIGLTKYYDGDSLGYMDGIVLDNIYASKAERLPVYHKGNSYVYPLIWIEGGLLVKNLTVRDLFRREKTIEIETLHVGKGARVDYLTLDGISVQSLFKEPVFRNYGSIGVLSAINMTSNGGKLFENLGTVDVTRVHSTVRINEET